MASSPLNEDIEMQDPLLTDNIDKDPLEIPTRVPDLSSTSIQDSPIINKSFPSRMSYNTPREQPEIICACPQKCDDKVPYKLRTYMFKYYQGLKDDKMKQETLLLRFIEMKSVARRLAEDKRVQCRYKAPATKEAIGFVFDTDSGLDFSCEENDNEETKKQKIYFNESHHNTMVELPNDATIKYRIDKNGMVEVCQKAFMNVFLVPEKRVRAVREKLVQKTRDDIMEKDFNSPLDNVKMSRNGKVNIGRLNSSGNKANNPVNNGGTSSIFSMFNKTIENELMDLNKQLLTAIDNDIELVSNFFNNQLWKPLDNTTKNTNGNTTGKKIKDFDHIEFASELITATMNSTLKQMNNTSNGDEMETTKDIENGDELDESNMDTTDVQSISQCIDDSDVFNATPNVSSLNNTEILNTLNLSKISDVSNTTDSITKNGFTDEKNNSKIQNLNESLKNVNKQQNSDKNQENGNGSQYENGLDLTVTKKIPADISIAKTNGISDAKNDNGFGKKVDFGNDINFGKAQNVHSNKSNGNPNNTFNNKNGSKNNSRHKRQRTEPMLNSSLNNIFNNTQLTNAQQFAQAQFINNQLALQAQQFATSTQFAQVQLAAQQEMAKYLSNMECSMSITPNNTTLTQANITARLIQSAFNTNTASTGSSLNQILNIPDSVSITPTLINK